MSKANTDHNWSCGADLVVKNLEAQGVKHVFGIPGGQDRPRIRFAGGRTIDRNRGRAS